MNHHGTASTSTQDITNDGLSLMIRPQACNQDNGDGAKGVCEDAACEGECEDHPSAWDMHATDTQHTSLHNTTGSTYTVH